MKKLLGILLAVVMMFSVVCALTACSSQAEIAVVTDVGSLMDGGFNQGTWEGAKAYAEANGLTYKYYQPANGSDATDNDRIAAMNLAVKNGAKVIVTPGFLQAAAIESVAEEHPEVKFIFVDGWALGFDNVTAIVYKEQESGYMAGYAAVKDGYTSLGGTFGGGGSNPACNRFAYGYLQGAIAAAAEKGVDVAMRLSFKYGDGFSASTELQTQIAGWYADGVQVVFSCGGSMFNSVKAAAEETSSGKIIGVDVDQANLSDRVLTSAVKGLSASVQKVLGELYEDKWDSMLANKASNLGASDDATGLPIDTSRFSSFSKADYTTLFNSIKNGTIVPDAEVAGDCNVASFWTEAAEGSRVTVTFEK